MFWTYMVSLSYQPVDEALSDDDTNVINRITVIDILEELLDAGCLTYSQIDCALNLVQSFIAEIGDSDDDDYDPSDFIYTGDF